MATRDLRLYELRSLSDMETIRDTWKRLVLSAPTTTSSQTWEWNFGMAKFEGSRVSLRILVAEDKCGEQVGIAPLLIRSSSVPGLKILEFLGRGEYSDLFSLEPYKDIFARSVMEWIEHNTEWRILRLQNLRQETVDLICRYGSFTIRPSGVCPRAQLPNTMEEYEQKILQKRLRQKIRQKRKLLAGNGRLAFSVCGTTSQLLAELPVFIDLHQRRQRMKGERGRFFEERWREAFQEISLALLQAGFLRLGLLRIDGQPAASLYNVRFRDHECFCYGGMAPSFAEYSPGNLLHHYMIEEAIRDGVRVYDFLKGDEPYKSLWTNDRCQLFEIVQARSRAEGILWHKTESLRNIVYRSRLIKRVYLATMGRLQNIRGKENDAH